jgi:hypothetical protein
LNSSEVSPQNVFDRLVSEAKDPRKKRSLDAIHSVCSAIYSRSSSDYSYVNIINVGGDKGLKVPSEKSITNKTGACYRELIQAWRIKSGVYGVKASKLGADWIEKIKDPVLRVSVLLLAKELRALKAQLARKAEHATTPVIVGTARGKAVSNRVCLNDAEISALKAAIDPQSLMLNGVTIGARGELIDSRKRVILKPGFRGAVEKVLSIRDD